METKNDNQGFDDYLGIRMFKTDLDNFKIKTSNIGKPYHIMIRELIEAFNDDRLRIIPNDKQKESLKIYKEKSKIYEE